MMKKIKTFFINLIPTKRRLIQIFAALLYNANIKGFISGEIFDGVSKSVCVPGLNCYSCPGAIGACPLGSLQNALAASKTKYPTYVIGIILLYSIILGRTICGFLCPIGLLQELLYKIKSPKLKKNKITRVLSYFKYVLLFALVIIIPLVYALQEFNIPLPAFCKYICPAGTFEGAIFLLLNPNNDDFFVMLGSLFTWKFILLITFIVASVFVYRFFCRFFCPLGALYGLFNKLSILGIKIDKDKCTSCGACVSHCLMDVKEVGDHECIQCGACKSVCKTHAIDWKVIRKIVREEIENENIIKQSEEVLIENQSEIKNKTLDKRLNSKTFNKIIIIILSILLIIALLYSNISKKTFKVNDICDQLKITYITEKEFDITKDSNATLLYFFTDELNIDNLIKYEDEKLNIILITSYDNKEHISNDLINELKDLNIFIAYDSKNNNTLKMFNCVNYNVSIFIDSSDKILFIKQGFITDEDFLSTISPVILGKVVGNKVGDICINKNINLIGSDDTFSVLNYRGKISIINFWYTSCTPCVQELPHFNSLYEEYKDYLTVIAIHEAQIYNSNPQDVSDFINNNFKGYSILFGYDDLNSPYYKELGGKAAFPVTVIVDEEGVISFIRHGSLDEQTLREQIELILGD